MLCVKGSGWDMAQIEPAGLPAVRLAALRKLRARDALSDEEMVRIQRANLLDPMAPNPSVETLLHAFLPHTFVDHTHATAVLSLIDQPNGAELCAEVFDGRMGFVPYVMPGFALAKKAADVYDAAPAVEGLILHKHGIFTFGATAREAYERMIAMVSRAEARLARGRKTVSRPCDCRSAIATLAEVAPMVRGACSLEDEAVEGAWRRLILDFRAGDAVLNFVNGAELARYSQAGVVTPDHTIRTKNWPLVVPAPESGKLDEFGRAVRDAVELSRMPTRPISRATTRVAAGESGCSIRCPAWSWCRGSACSASAARKPTRASPPTSPRRRSRPSRMRRRSAASSRSTKPTCSTSSTGRSSRRSSAKAPEKPLAGQVAVITGAGGAIGAATARAFAAAGAEVALLDVDLAAAEKRAKEIGGAARALACDVRDAASVRAAFDRVVEEFGGVDIAVSNAGAAWQGRIGEVDEAVLRESFELNFYGHQRVAQNAVRVMLAQATGGCLLFNVSKQAVNPGPNFGPYGLPKAATLLLVRQYALDYGAGRHPRQRRQCRPHPLRPDDRRVHRGARASARRERSRLHARQPARPRSHRRRRRAGVPGAGAGAQDHRRRHHRRRRQHRGGAAVT